jgi:hypothetical protein
MLNPGQAIRFTLQIECASGVNKYPVKFCITTPAKYGKALKLDNLAG